MNQIDQLVAEILQIKKQYEAQVTGRHKQWPRAIKERVAALAKVDIRLKSIAERTGISYHTVTSWCAPGNKNAFREVAVIAAPRKVATATKKPVTVTKNASAVTVTKESVTVTIQTPDGFIIHAASGADAILIVRGLRVSGRD